MKALLKKTFLTIFTALFSYAVFAQTTIVNWDFGTTTTSTVPAIGTGTLSLIGGTTYDPDKTGVDVGVATVNGTLTPTETGWGYTIITFPNQGTNNKTAGIQFNMSTVGYENIKFTVDVRHGNKCANTMALQYTVNGGIDWIDATTFTANITDDTWYHRTYDFSSNTAVNNNANFAVRLVSSFQESTSTYMPSNTTSTYATNKGYRFDNVGITGDLLTDDNITFANMWKVLDNTIMFGDITPDNIEVYDLLGNKLIETIPTSEITLSLNKGIYIIKVGSAVKKIVINAN